MNSKGIRAALPPVHVFAGRDLPWLLAARAHTHANRPSVIWDDEGEVRIWTYSEFHADVKRLAAGLHARGVGEGDFVLVHLDNCVEFLLAWHACAHLGAVAVTTNSRSADDELTYFIGHSRATCAITQPSLVDAVTRCGTGLGWIAVTGKCEGDGASFHSRPSLVNFADLVSESAKAPSRPADPGLLLSIQYTSGTTSRPKGVMWTHANGLWAAKINAAHQSLTEEDRLLVCFPLFHANALGYSALSAIWAGACIVLMPRFSARRFWDVAVRHQCTGASMTPFGAKALAERPSPETHRFRYWGFQKGEHLPIREKWGIPLVGWWGMTETISHGIISEPSLPVRSGAIGQAAAEYEVKILSDTGEHAGIGEPGRLFVRGIRGLSLFAGYLHDEVATDSAFSDDGFFDTGDVVTAYEDGAIEFTERAKDMLRIGSENVAASEIERVLLACQGVSEAAVVGEPHPFLDEVPIAFVVPIHDAGSGCDELERGLRATCGAKLADFKRPHEFVFVDALPRSGPLSKISKAELRRELQTIRRKARLRTSHGC